jgi:SET domain-containing protein
LLQYPKCDKESGVLQKTNDINFVQKIVIDNIPNTEIKKSTLHGFGLFARKEISAQTTICLLDGQVMDWDQYESNHALLKESAGALNEYFFMEWNALDKNTLLVRAFRTKYSYINHSKTPNVKVFSFPHRIVAIQDISVGEELTINYNDEPLRDAYFTNEKEFLK